MQSSMEKGKKYKPLDSRYPTKCKYCGQGALEWGLDTESKSKKPVLIDLYGNPHQCKNKITFCKYCGKKEGLTWHQKENNEWELIEEDGSIHNCKEEGFVRCRACGKRGLVWKQKETGKWTLLEITGNTHNCTAEDLFKQLHRTDCKFCGVGPLKWMRDSNDRAYLVDEQGYKHVCDTEIKVRFQKIKRAKELEAFKRRNNK